MDVSEVARAADLLEAQGRTLVELGRGLERELVRWVPSRGGWCIAEIYGHLLDEETEDFRLRVASTLEDPGRPWPGIDPEARVAGRDWASRDLAATLESFAAARRDSVAWLREQTDADWHRIHLHPRFGAIGARDLLASWLDHDRLHLRQILTRLHDASDLIVEGGETAYAGEW
ncbi:MAG: DinB family protein [Planctomycetota bacterium]